MMEQAADDERGWRAMECGGGGIGDGSDDKGRDSGGKVEDGGDGCSKCDGNGSGDGNGHGVLFSWVTPSVSLTYHTLYHTHNLQHT